METLVSKALMIRLSLQPSGFRRLSHQQYPRLPQPLRRALAFPYQRFKLFAFLAARPHNILLYRSFLGSMIASSLALQAKRITKTWPFKLIEAGD
jgi:hypothetical protein